MLYLLIGLLIGLGLYHFVLTRHIHYLTKQIAQLRQYKLQRELSTLSSSRTFQKLLLELSEFIESQKETIIELQQDKVHLKADLMNISHDLRTPLTAIYGYLQLLNDEPLTPQERAYYLEIATKRTETLEKLIQNLFYLGKLEANTLTYHRAPLRLDFILKEQIISLYQPFEEAAIQVTIDRLEQTTVTTDKAAVERIFNNLLLNVIQHGTMSLTISHHLDDNDRCYTRFSNSLRTNVKPDIHQVFQRHYTGEPHRNQNNNGLGLAICAELCQQLGHIITASIEDEQFIIEINW